MQSGKRELGKLFAIALCMGGFGIACSDQAASEISPVRGETQRRESPPAPDEQEGEDEDECGEEDCDAGAPRATLDTSGRWDGTNRYEFADLFTVGSVGPVDATTTVTGFTGSMYLALLGFDPATGMCREEFTPTPIPRGPVMETPTITAHWDAVPVGTYCLNVVGAAPAPPYPPAYTWTATITYPR